MKKTITLALAMLTFASVAQYNHTYDINNASSDIKPSFVITNKNAESITVSYGKAATNPDIDYFIVTKHDASGGVIYNNNIFPYFFPTDGITNVEALIQTDDEGVLIAGYHYDNEKHVEQPIVIKLNVKGDFEWSRIYYVNKYPIIGSEIGKISLCRVADEEKECYFIVAAGNSDANPKVDVATNVIKIDDNGGMIFSKKYYDVNGSAFKILREYPGDMEFAKEHGMYMITGYRQQYGLTKGHVMYYFGIDKDGTVITKYLTMASKSIPVDQDMIYDAKNDVFATAFTHMKQGLETGPASLMGLVTIKPNLSVTNTMYYWHQQGYENNARSISLASSGEYLICEDIYDLDAGGIHNPGWLKVAPNGTPWAAIFSYNVLDNTVFGHHATSFNPFSGKDEYVLVNEQKTDLRVIRTIDLGNACGIVKWKSLEGKYEAKLNTYAYEGKDVGELKKYEIKYKIFEPDYRKCSGDDTPSYRSIATGVAQGNDAENTMVMYPTVMSSADARLTVQNNAAASVKLEVYTITGQCISSSHVTPGRHEIQLNTNGNLSEGIYLVKCYGTNGSLTTTNKILITK